MPLWTILEKCPAPTLPAWTQPNSPARLERVEGGLHLRDVLRGAAGHQRVAVLQTPDAPGDATVDEPDAVLGQQLGVHQVVGPAGVAAVDHHVTLVEQLGERADRLPGRLAGGHHHPDHLRGGQARDERLEAVDVTHLGVEVEPDDVVAGAAQPLAHVATHLAEADESELHVCVPPGGVLGRQRCSAPRAAPGQPARAGLRRAAAAASAGSGSRGSRPTSSDWAPRHHRRLRGLGERHLDHRGLDRGQPVEEELRVEARW